MGGRAERCNTELHDIVFVVGNSLEETYPQLIKKWFGNTKRLHIDSSIELKHVDGHEMNISSEPPAKDTAKSLFFVNFGGYKQGYFGEIHNVNFYVASSKTEALERAKIELCKSLFKPHCDDNHEINSLIDQDNNIDDICEINKIDQYYIHVMQTSQPSFLKIESYYRKLNLPEIMPS
jgi:hypothetical protein